jgi:hypothetical protein
VPPAARARITAQAVLRFRAACLQAGATTALWLPELLQRPECGAQALPQASLSLRSR